MNKTLNMSDVQPGSYAFKTKREYNAYSMRRNEMKETTNPLIVANLSGKFENEVIASSANENIFV
jgi:hypothetical protein